MSPRPRALPVACIAPCLPANGPQPHSGEEWLHEIKHDGFRVVACKEGKRVKVYNRPDTEGRNRSERSRNSVPGVLAAAAA